MTKRPLRSNHVPIHRQKKRSKQHLRGKRPSTGTPSAQERDGLLAFCIQLLRSDRRLMDRCLKYLTPPLILQIVESRLHEEVSPLDSASSKKSPSTARTPKQHSKRPAHRSSAARKKLSIDLSYDKGINLNMDTRWAWLLENATTPAELRELKRYEERYNRKGSRK